MIWVRLFQYERDEDSRVTCKGNFSSSNLKMIWMKELVAAETVEKGWAN